MKFVENLTIPQHDGFVSRHPNGHFMQLSDWGSVKTEWLTRHVALLNEKGEIKAVAQILTRKGMWYIPRGPVMDYTDNDLVTTFLLHINNYAIRHHAKYIKIDPPVIRTYANGNGLNATKHNSQIVDQFIVCGYEHQGFSLEMNSTVQPRYNMVTDTSKDILEILDKKTRRLVRDAYKKHITITKGDISDLDDFMHVIHCTEKRQGIHLRNKTYFETLMKKFGDKVNLYIARINVHDSLKHEETRKVEIEEELKHCHSAPKKARKLLEQLESVNRTIAQLCEIETTKEPQVVCGALSIRHGNKEEILYAGNDERFAKFSGQYAVFAHLMSESHKNGIKEVSMGGVTGDLSDSLSKFKSKFATQVIEYYGEFDLPLSKTYDYLYNKVLPMYRKFRKTFKRT